MFVAPTRYGAGMPHKIHEAAAHGLPVVATHLLAAQLNWRDAVDIAAGSDPQTFGERCVQLHEDRKYWETLRENALVRVMKECSVKDFEERLTAIIRPF